LPADKVDGVQDMTSRSTGASLDALSMARMKDFGWGNGLLLEARGTSRRIGDLVELCYTALEPHRLRTICDFLYWLWLVDDALECERDALDAHARWMPVLSVLRDASPSDSTLRDLPAAARDSLVAILAELTSRWHADWFQYFKAVTADFLNSAIDEVGRRQKQLVPSFADYTRHRLRVGAVPSALALVCYASSLELPTVQLECAPIAELLEHANRAICWTNDVDGFEREVVRGHDVHNLILVLARERNISLDEARRQALLLAQRIRHGSSRARSRRGSRCTRAGGGREALVDGLALLGAPHFAARRPRRNLTRLMTRAY
jgi:hypothetical protein